VSFDDDILELREALFRICKENAGMGLAANQIGSNLRAFVIDNGGLKLYANPEIVEASEPFVFDGEGCLSFPGEVLCTRRYKKILLRSDSGPDEILTGIVAVAAQHELDHLNGITMHDRSKI
jgi:peptide deformylase